jgi:PPOX class probable F420-dependent enzyme
VLRPVFFRILRVHHFGECEPDIGDRCVGLARKACRLIGNDSARTPRNPMNYGDQIITHTMREYPSMSTQTLPETHKDLLERPTFAHLATIRPDGSPQSSVMWFDWDGSRLRMTHTKTRQKFKNLQNEPHVAISIADPEDSYRFLEVRGVVESIEDDDAEASFYKSLQHRYGNVYDVTDADVRVIMTIKPETFIAVKGGSVTH